MLALCIGCGSDEPTYKEPTAAEKETQTVKRKDMAAGAADKEKKRMEDYKKNSNPNNR
jgi:hypothetical protein